MARNPDTKTIPCHRVVGTDGRMHGYSAKKGIPSKVNLLQSEGVEIRGGVVDLGKYQW